MDLTKAIIIKAHIYPVNDLSEHLLSSEIYFEDNNRALMQISCSCKPNIKWIISEKDTRVVTLLITHNSFDGREGVEWANEILP